MPIEVAGLDHVHLSVRDLERAVAFYRDAFGAEELFRLDDKRMAFVRLRSRGVVTLHETGRAGIEHIGLALAGDLDDAVADVVRAGGRVVERGEHAPGEAYAYVADPDGNVIEL